MSKKETAIFWNTARTYLDHHLKEIRQVSMNTVESYRNCLNCFIDYLENEINIKRNAITFNHFDKETLTGYQAWMIKERKLAPKTCNLRMTAIRSLLEYASQNYLWIMPIYTDACKIVGVTVENKPIEYFEPEETKALLNAPPQNSRTGRRNKMIFIFMYDTAARVAEVLHVRLCDLHLDAKVPYETLLGKGRKYRNIPLMEKTVLHLRRYLKEFHNSDMKSESPLFYSRLHGQKHALSSDTLEKLIKKYAAECAMKGNNMPEDSHCHMLRKTRAMDLYLSGVPLTHIQQLLGHEHISTTSGFYAFVTLDVLAKEMEKINPDAGVRKWDDPQIQEMLYRL